MIFDRVPEAVQKVFANNDTWWEHGQRSSMKQFLSQYTLHDSRLLGIEFQYFGYARAFIKFDMIWIPTTKKLDWPTSEGDSHYSGESYLCINFPEVHQILSDQAEKYVVDDAISHASTKSIEAKKRLLWLELFTELDIVGEDAGNFLLDENLHCTNFEGTGDHHVYIIHSEPTSFLCLDSNGSIVELPDLELVANG